MNHLEDRFLLLGLLVTTQPFEYTDNTVSSNYNQCIEVFELHDMKNKLTLELENGSNTMSDEEKIGYSDAIYFIDKSIEALEMKINGNNL